MKHAWVKNLGWGLLSFLLLFGITGADAQSNSTYYTILLTDISGSMDERDASGIVKLEAARQAANTFVNVVDAEGIRTGIRQDYLSLISFCSNANLEIGFSQDLNAVRNEINGLFSCGATNMVDGISASIGEISKRPLGSNTVSSVILLSDGMPTTNSQGVGDSLSLQAEILGILPTLSATGTCLYIIPLGNPNASPGSDGYVDLNFLQQMADVMACGELFPFVTANQLQQIYLETRARSQGNVIIVGQTNVIIVGQTLPFPVIDVQPNQAQLRIDTSWIEGVLEVRVYDPNGVLVTNSYPGASIANLNNLSQIVIANPIAGRWRAEVIAQQIPSGQTTFSSSVSVSPPTIITPPPNNGLTVTQPAPTVLVNSSDGDMTMFGIILILIVIGFGVIFAVVYSQRGAPEAPMLSGQNSGPMRPAYLVFLNGPRVGQQIAINSPNYTIGRRGGNNLQLQDGMISREHARILYTANMYYIRDLSSQSGTKVNNLPIQDAQVLNHGDQISIGRVSLQFLQY